MAMVRFRSVLQQLQYNNSDFVKDLNPQAHFLSYLQNSDQYSNQHDFSLWIFGIFGPPMGGGRTLMSSFLTQTLKKGASYSFSFFLIQRDFVRKENVEKTKLDWSTEREFRRQQLLSQTLVFYGSTQLTYLLFQKLKLEKVLINVPPQSFKQAETWLRLLCRQVNDSDSL